MLSWHEKEENILYSFHHRTKYIYKLRIVLSTQYKYRITLINVNLIIFSTISLTLSVPALFFLMTILENFRLFPLQLILKQKWAPSVKWEFDKSYELLSPQNVHTQKHLHEILRSLLSTLPSQGHSCTSDHVSVTDYFNFIFVTTLHGRYCYLHNTEEETGPYEAV